MPEPTYTDGDLRRALVRRSLDDGVEPDVTDLRARLDALLAEPAGTTSDPAASGGEALELVPRAERTSRRRVGLLAAATAACLALGAIGIAALRESSAGDDTPATGAHPTDGLVLRTPVTRIPSSVPKQVRDSVYPGTQYVGVYSGAGSATVTLPHRQVPENYEWTGAYICAGTPTTISLGSGQVRSEGPCETGSYAGMSLHPSGDTLTVGVAPATRWTLWAFLSPTTQSNAPDLLPVDALQLAQGKSIAQHVKAAGRGDGTVRIPSPRSLAGARGLVIDASCTGSGLAIDGFTPQGLSGRAYTDTCFDGWSYQWQTSRIGDSMTLHVHASDDTSWRFVVSG